MNYGFINLNNDANEYPFKLNLDDKSDPLYNQKYELIGNELTNRTYRCMADLGEENTYKMFSYLRFIEFDGDMMTLQAAKMRDEKNRVRGQDEDSDDAPGYKAENLPVISFNNEVRVMKRVL